MPHGSTRARDTDASLAAAGAADKLRFLGDPASYPHRPSRVATVETHLSWVFIAGSRVYKLKKPIRLPDADLTTLDARAHYVNEEIRLNRRLAGPIYLGATALSRDRHGHLTLGKGETAVDWLVTMRRLPEARMLDRLIARRRLTEAMIESLADRLVDFFAGQAPERPPVERVMTRFETGAARMADILMHPRIGLDRRRIGPALDALSAALPRIRPLIQARIDRGRIVEGHGDLRPEHVCFVRPIAIIDALEFAKPLRQLDPFEEIAFLGLECARLGDTRVFATLLARAADRLGGTPPPELVAFYWRYRALMRARFCLAHLLDAKPRQRHKWRPLARRYVALAERDPARITASDR